MKSKQSYHPGRKGKLAGGFALAVAAIISGFLLLPTASPAVSLSGDSSTYVQSKQEADSTKVLGAYEYLNFAVQDLGNETISFHTGGWLRYDLQGEAFDKRSNSDLQYSYLSFKSKTDNATVNLGRVMVFEGVASERVDGIYAHTDLRKGFGVSAFGGNPVETGEDLPTNSVIYGARLSHQYGDLYQIGISALQEKKESADFRKEGGIDVWVHPIDKVDLTGKSTYNDITKGWMENTYALVLGPFADLRLTSSASWINYDDYFYGTTVSAFTVASDMIQPHEKVRILGEEASYPVTEKVQVSVDYKNYTYDIAGKANYYGGKVRFAAAENGGAGAAYHRMDGQNDELKYNEYRIYAYRKLGSVDVTADIIDVAYDTAINGVKDAYTGSLAAQYALTEAWKLGADVEYSRNPDFDRDVRTFLKVLYRFGAKGGA